MTDEGTPVDDSTVAPTDDGITEDVKPTDDGTAPVDDGKTVLTDDNEPQGAPETYADFTMPEGITIDQVQLDMALPLFKRANLSQIEAQEIVDAEAARVQAASTASSESYNQQLKDWVTEAKGDSEIGGDAFDQNVGAAKAALDKLGTPALVQMLDQTGLGSHPEIIRYMVRTSKFITEDDPGGDGDAAQGEKSQADILYPKSA